MSYAEVAGRCAPPSAHEGSICAALIEAAYADGRDLAVAETPFDYERFPERCPWGPEQILDDCWSEAEGS